MYLWKVDALVEDFKAGKVSQKEEFKYMLLLTIALVAVTDPALHIDSSYNFYDTIESVITLIISILGVYYCYKINSSGDNKDFIVRMTCIGLPILIRVLVFMIPVLLVGTIVDFTLVNPESLYSETVDNTPIQVAIVSIFSIAYYWYLGKKIKAVSA